MSSTKLSELGLDDLSNIDITLMMLRKPTELKKVIDSIPKPIRAVPKNGLPLWYRLGLECKLPVPKMPKGKIIFSRGKIGEDIRRLGLGGSGPQPTFDLTDPYCNNVSYDYVPMHDPHLAHHFTQKPARNRMNILGFCTRDSRAVCSLKEFNQYRKYLYNQFMDRIHMEMKNLDERARDDLTLKRVEVDVARRLQVFTKAERAREHLERIALEHAEECAEKKRLAKEQEKKILARMTYLAEYNEHQRKERAARAREKQNRIKQRVQAAAEMELRRKITMVRQWRTNEKKRLNRVKQEREAKQKRLEDQANNKWIARVEAQNQKIHEEALLLKLYTEDMSAGAYRREKKAEIYAYNTDLELQRIRLANWKQLHGGTAKAARLVKKMGVEFEKSKRGAKGMSPELAQSLAAEAMSTAVSTQGDALMTLGQARARMDLETVLPSAPLKLLDEMLESAVTEFARRRVHQLLRDVERVVYKRAALVFFQSYRTDVVKKRKVPRWSTQVAAEFARQYVNAHEPTIAFGDIINIAADDPTDIEMKSVKDRPPTPVPSKTKLAEVTFSDRVEDLPDPVAVGTYLPERRKLLEMINAAAKLLSRSVSQRVQKGMDVTVGKVTLPHMRHPMEWGEAVEGLAEAVVDNRVHSDCADVRRTGEFLAHRILRSLLIEMKEEKQRRKNSMMSCWSEPETRDFYVPGAVKESLGLVRTKRKLYEVPEKPKQPEFEYKSDIPRSAANEGFRMLLLGCNGARLIRPNQRQNASSHNIDVKERRSSNASLLLMNPVASGDNVTTGLNSTHKLKEELPPLTPCCEGREIRINEDLVRSGLSAISLKHDSVIQCWSMSQACERMQVPPGLINHRNSFRSLHRPDLKRVPYLRRMSPDELETLFRGYADTPVRGNIKNDKRETMKLMLPPDENSPTKTNVIRLEDANDDNGISALHPISETRSGVEDVPAGMRLHGARARLYTSVLAGAKAGDQLDGIQANEEYDSYVPDDGVPEDEVQLHEELQILLPPRCDDVTAGSSVTATSPDNTIG